MSQLWYSVHFNIVGTNREYASRTKTVSIAEGFSTFEDIRKILSISLGLKPENIDIETVIKMER